jgi:hypothetical protein
VELSPVVKPFAMWLCKLKGDRNQSSMSPIS